MTATPDPKRSMEHVFVREFGLMSQISIDGYWTTVKNGRVLNKGPWALVFDVSSLASYIADPTECGFVYFYDAADVCPNVPFLPIDWGLPALLQANIRRSSTFDALAAAALDDFGCPHKISEALASLPLKMHLAACDDLDALEVDIQAAIAAMCTVPGIGVSIATKMLHKKRPHLVPVMDTVVQRFIIGATGGNPRTAARAICGRFQQLLRREVNGLTLLSNKTGGLIADRCCGKHHDTWPQLSLPRLLDMCIWLATERLEKLKLDHQVFQSGFGQAGLAVESADKAPVSSLRDPSTRYKLADRQDENYTRGTKM